MLEHLVPLALKVKDAKVTSVQFVPPLIHTGYPDWDKIRRLTEKAIADSVREPSPAASRPAQASGRSSGGKHGPERLAGRGGPDAAVRARRGLRPVGRGRRAAALTRARA